MTILEESMEVDVPNSVGSNESQDSRVKSDRNEQLPGSSPAAIRNPRNRGISISAVSMDDTPMKIKEDFNRHLHTTLAKDYLVATTRDYYLALAHTVWERISVRWLRTLQQEFVSDKRVILHT